MHKLKFICVLVIGIFMISCNKNVIFSEYQKLPEEGWKVENKLTYSVDIKDITSLNSVFINVRHADAYPYSNLFLFLTTTYPSGQMAKDTIECLLANKKGEWQGDGAGEIWDTKIPLKKNMKFPKVGKYTFTFEQAMRSNPLPLIMDFGITIEKAE